MLCRHDFQVLTESWEGRDKFIVVNKSFFIVTKSKCEEPVVYSITSTVNFCEGLCAAAVVTFSHRFEVNGITMPWPLALVLAIASYCIVLIICILFPCCWSKPLYGIESALNHMNTDTDAPLASMEDISRIARPRSYHQSLSVDLPPEIILTPTQHAINAECDSPPSYESLFPK